MSKGIRTRNRQLRRDGPVVDGNDRAGSDDRRQQERDDVPARGPDSSARRRSKKTIARGPEALAASGFDRKRTGSETAGADRLERTRARYEGGPQGDGFEAGADAGATWDDLFPGTQPQPAQSMAAAPKAAPPAKKMKPQASETELSDMKNAMQQQWQRAMMGSAVASGSSTRRG